MTRKEVRIAGFGGQGIILSAKIIGKAAGIYSGNKESVVMEVYGPESRGGATSGTIVVGDNKGDIDYPYVTTPEYLIFMSQAAYVKYRPEVTEKTIMVIDESLVELEPEPTENIFKIPATKFAEEMGKRIVANVIMLGFVASATDIVPSKAMKDSVLASVKKRFISLNDKAFQIGFDYGEKLKKEGKIQNE